jgi:hypothetical protein
LRKVLLGEDSSLKRQVWIVLRPRGSPPPEAARRDLTRPTRTRWLTGGDQAEGRWDAYVAPAGCPIADLAGPAGSPWGDVLPLLQDLAEELALACSEGTLPNPLSIEQVWVEPDGRILLVDALTTEAGGSAEEDDQTRALSLMRQVAAIALEGGRRRASDRTTPIRAVVPLHAGLILDRLCGVGEPFRDVAACCIELQGIQERPTEVGRVRRASRLAIMTILLGPGLVLMFGTCALCCSLVSWPEENGTMFLQKLFTRDPPWIYSAIALPALLWVIWAGATRGGISLPMMGMELVCGAGRRAGRIRCAWRSLMTWAPAVALLEGAAWVLYHQPKGGLSFWGLWGAAIAVLVIDLVVALVIPARSLHDWLAGTHLAPK